MTNNKVELYVGDKIYGYWTELQITRCIEELSGAVEFVASHQLPDIIPGAACYVEIDGQRVITGFINDKSTSIDATSYAINIAACDKTQDLIDCAAIYKSGQWRNASLHAIAKNLCEPFGVGVVWNVKNNNADAEFKYWQIEPGETVYENLSRAARHRGVLLHSNELGELVFATANSESCATLAVGENVLSLQHTQNDRNKFSLYRVQGDNSAGGWWGETQSVWQSTAFKIDTHDKTTSRYRPAIIIADDNLTNDIGVARGEYERRRAFAHSNVFTVTMLGWFIRDAELWQINKLVTLTDSEKIAHELLITRVTFNLNNDGGQITTLELMPREGFDLPAQKDEPFFYEVWL